MRKTCFLIAGLLIFVCILGNNADSFFPKNKVANLNGGVVAVFMTIPDGDIIVEDRAKYLNLRPEDEVRLPISGKMVSVKFINFFFRTFDEDGAEVLRSIR
ncbi:MAG: hypothetical protein Athens071425_400 [Parcubacteria group bacterium Athens0714_25]|nr:MAG: hypothetical protein Athens071425_400 [Parcubacteria group bacterium Athens0714_25]